MKSKGSRQLYSGFAGGNGIVPSITVMKGSLIIGGGLQITKQDCISPGRRREYSPVKNIDFQRILSNAPPNEATEFLNA